MQLIIEENDLIFCYLIKYVIWILLFTVKIAFVITIFLCILNQIIFYIFSCIHFLTISTSSSTSWLVLASMTVAASFACLIFSIVWLPPSLLAITSNQYWIDASGLKSFMESPSSFETYRRTYSGHFWNMSIFDYSRAIWVLFRKWVVSENQSFLDEGVIVTPLIGLNLDLIKIIQLWTFMIFCGHFT